MERRLRRGIAVVVVVVLVPVLLVGARPGPTQGTYFPIKHVVVIMQENHSFDNYFGTFPGANGFARAPHTAQQKAHTMTTSTHDLCHSASCSRGYHNGGKMDGWTDFEAFGTYTAKSIPYYWKLAENFTLLDNYFSGFMGPSLPNRVVAIAGSNYGGTTSQTSYDGERLNLTIFDQLNAADVSWKYYTAYSDSFNGFNPLPLTTHHYTATDYQVFEQDISSRNLPEVSWVMPESDNLSEHPPYNVTAGMGEVKKLIDSVMKSNYWQSTAILLTWDEAGGYYDHVAPPKGTFGFRVPMIVISPFAFRGLIDGTFSSHASILAFIERMFRLPCMKIDCSASDLTEAFNFGHKDISRLGVAYVGRGPVLLVTTELGPGLGFPLPAAGTKFPVPNSR